MQGKNNIIGCEIIKIMRTCIRIVTEAPIGLTHNSIFDTTVKTIETVIKTEHSQEFQESLTR
jgi:hypothetical protein